jgi:hypothetical protein
VFDAENLIINIRDFYWLIFHVQNFDLNWTRCSIIVADHIHEIGASVNIFSSFEC